MRPPGPWTSSILQFWRTVVLDTLYRLCLGTYVELKKYYERKRGRKKKKEVKEVPAQRINIETEMSGETVETDVADGQTGPSRLGVF